MILIQHILMWPLLFIAYINWLYKSVGHIIGYPNISTKQRRCALCYAFVFCISLQISAIAFHLWMDTSIFSFWHPLPAKSNAFVSAFSSPHSIELSAIVFHHLWLNASIFGALGFTWQAATYWAITHCISGFLTSFIFVQVRD